MDKQSKIPAALLSKLGADLGFESMEERGSDSLDFHSVGVLSLRDALAAA
jgi:hypothetical protein